jgi:NTP pyrophosphatase (non-canonical NTP hydrolase)
MESNDKGITLQEAQAKVDQWIQTIGVRYFSELTNLAVLMEEVGELSRLMARTYGEQSFKEKDKESNIPSEMGDILFVLICLANQMGISLEEALLSTLKKNTERDQNRHRKNEKLHSS